MAYFPNGASLEQFERDVCSGCVHRDGSPGEEGCPIIAAHMLYWKKDEGARSVLNLLIPVTGRTCSSFHADGK